MDPYDAGGAASQRAYRVVVFERIEAPSPVNEPDRLSVATSPVAARNDRRVGVSGARVGWRRRPNRVTMPGQVTPGVWLVSFGIG